jgi:hypothetical protein
MRSIKFLIVRGCREIEALATIRFLIVPCADDRSAFTSIKSLIVRSSHRDV